MLETLSTINVIDLCQSQNDRFSSETVENVSNGVKMSQKVRNIQKYNSEKIRRCVQRLNAVKPSNYIELACILDLLEEHDVNLMWMSFDVAEINPTIEFSVAGGTYGVYPNRESLIFVDTLTNERYTVGQFKPIVEAK